MFGIQHSVSVFDNEQGLNTSASSVMNDNSGMTQQSHDANHFNEGRPTSSQQSKIQKSKEIQPGATYYHSSSKDNNSGREQR
jgi:hypothetical protein